MFHYQEGLIGFWSMGKQAVNSEMEIKQSKKWMQDTEKTYLCDEVWIRHEKLLSYVKNSKNSSQLVLKSHFGSFCRILCNWMFVAVDFRVKAGSAGLNLLCGERQDSAEQRWEARKESPWPISVAEERTCCQHRVGEHPWTGLKIQVNTRQWRKQRLYSCPESEWSSTLTDAEQLRVHAVEIRHEEKRKRPCGIKK